MARISRSPEARLPLVILALGLGLGLLGDALFNGATLGVNLPLWIGVLAGLGWLTARRAGRWSTATAWFVGLACFFAACLAWRASAFLRFWNVAAILAAAVTLAVQARRPIARAWPRDYLRGAGDAALDLGLGALLTASEVRLTGSGFARRLPALLVGIALAVPVVVIFGSLLTSADPVLEAFVFTLFDWDVEQLLRHGVLVGVTGWLAAGWLRSLAVARHPSGGPPPAIGRRFGIMEIGIPLGALTLLLAGFVGLQARYLFGGEAIVRLTGLSYAEFARRGFFELVVVSALVLPLLLGAERLLDRGRGAAVESFRALLVVLVGLVALVMVSALARMRLYVGAYGLTEDRFYATAFMLWIGVVLVWFVVTELRDRLGRFATGAVLAGFALLAALNAVNPDAVIARTNVARAGAGHRFDPAYLTSLSADAVPAIARGWTALDEHARCVLASGVIATTASLDDWREWSWSRWRAARAADRLVAPSPCPSGERATDGGPQQAPTGGPGA